MKIRNLINSLALLLWLCIASFSVIVSSGVAIGQDLKQTSKRVPAEWELQEAIWLQWPGQYEKTYEKAFARIASIIPEYEKLHILYDNSRIQIQAKNAIVDSGGNPDHSNIQWHKIRNDNAWMRDNGPVYVIEDGEMRIQNWEFDAWGGAFGEEIAYQSDNKIPNEVGRITRIPIDTVPIVHERGNLEFNGVDTVILNWSTLGDPNRNPGYSKLQAEKDIKQHFGVSRVVFVEGVVEGDLTRGHIDGIARFINQGTVVVPNCTDNSACKPGGEDDRVYDNAAKAIEEAGFVVIRDPIKGFVSFGGYKFDANYMNWLVGNGFVITVGFGDETLDQAAKARIEGYFPDRDVYVIETLESWAAGGGVHCHTNDQPNLGLVDDTTFGSGTQ